VTREQVDAETEASWHTTEYRELFKVESRKVSNWFKSSEQIRDECFQAVNHGYRAWKQAFEPSDERMLGIWERICINIQKIFHNERP